ncbi:MAG: DUF4433 domain-containing protein [Verrucomicrobia bacterium]|jgi:hypothetical protein|nr:DUF4433 domain-containing protein [Verrucomicrobiota bacterium]
MTVPDPTPIYHLTHWSNLTSIVEQGGVLSLHEMQRRGLPHEDIAYHHIQERREGVMVFSAAGGCLHDYASLHFGLKSPMLFTISKGNVPNQPEGQDPLIYLVSCAQQVEQAGLSFAFTDGHATMAFTEFFEDLGQLGRVDWGVINARYWNDTPDAPDRKRRRQAEFLVHEQLPWRLVSEIGTFDAGIKDQVQAIVQASEHRPAVHVRRNWYY